MPPAGPDIDMIAARAAAAPGGHWIAWPDSVWIPWHGLDDAKPESAWDHGRYLAVQDNDWHGSDQPPAALWAFLTAARDDVLTLTAEVRRLRGLLALAAQPQHPGVSAEWGCRQCGAAYFGTPPDEGLCPRCHANGQVMAVTYGQSARQSL